MLRSQIKYIFINFMLRQNYYQFQYCLKLVVTIYLYVYRNIPHIPILIFSLNINIHIGLTIYDAINLGRIVNSRRGWYFERQERVKCAVGPAYSLYVCSIPHFLNFRINQTKVRTTICSSSDQDTMPSTAKKFGCITKTSVLYINGLN